jgi:CubicO group peptidase (beta-lactamase class C family)
MAVTVQGSVEPGFEAVAAAFEQGFVGRSDMGAALAIRHNGHYVARLWGGLADARGKAPWAADTLSVIFSCTKGLMSLAIARLVERGLVDYEAPVARYWPEFAAGGKERITVREALSHRAGLVAPRISFTTEQMLDWDYVTSALAAQEPVFPPDSGYQYHSLTHGWLTGELIRRVTGLTPGAYLRREMAGPLGASVHVGLPPELGSKVAHLVTYPGQVPADLPPPPEPNWPLLATTLGDALPATLITEAGGFNDPRLHAAEIPGAGGIATADGLATIWSAAVTETEGVRLAGEAVIERATREQSGGPAIWPGPPPYHRWGMGFMLDCKPRPLLTERGFGHDGAGGQVAFADPIHKVGFAYLTNRMEGPPDNRGNDIVTALRKILSS